jgi:peroxin-5
LKDEQNFEKKLEMEYQRILEEMEKNGNYEELMSDAWQKASDLQEFELYKDKSDVYHF